MYVLSTLHDSSTDAHLVPLVVMFACAPVLWIECLCPSEMMRSLWLVDWLQTWSQTPPFALTIQTHDHWRRMWTVSGESAIFMKGKSCDTILSLSWRWATIEPLFKRGRYAHDHWHPTSVPDCTRPNYDVRIRKQTGHPIWHPLTRILCFVTQKCHDNFSKCLIRARVIA